MKARVAKPFEGARDGELYPRRFDVGELVEGDLARVAIAAGWAESLETVPVEASESPRRRPTRR